jgi:branched-subunit amino acid aminotransferase/4-amino-4-deoxychorismate lyase
MRVIIDGISVSDAEAGVSVFDWGVQRGFGAFEVIRSYDGAVFRAAAHLDRLERSLAALHIDPPDRRLLAAWVEQVAEEGGDGVVRVIVTGGGRDPLFAAPSRTVVMWEPPAAVPETLRLEPMTASWHPGTSESMFPGVKWLSYAPNMAATDAARRNGFDDALLLTRDGFVLEGPTFTVAWGIDGVIETPGMELGILASITRRVLLESAERLGVDVRPGAYSLDRLLAADEVMALSTTKEVTVVSAVGGDELGSGPLAGRLLAALRAIVAEEIG